MVLTSLHAHAYLQQHASLCGEGGNELAVAAHHHGVIPLHTRGVVLVPPRQRNLQPRAQEAVTRGIQAATLCPVLAPPREQELSPNASHLAERRGTSVLEVGNVPLHGPRLQRRQLGLLH